MVRVGPKKKGGSFNCKSPVKNCKENQPKLIRPYLKKTHIKLTQHISQKRRLKNTGWQIGNRTTLSRPINSFGRKIGTATVTNQEAFDPEEHYTNTPLPRQPNPNSNPPGPGDQEVRSAVANRHRFLRRKMTIIHEPIDHGVTQATSQKNNEICESGYPWDLQECSKIKEI